MNPPQPDSASHQPPRSFVRRQGRITVAQRRALTEQAAQFTLSAKDLVDLNAAFQRAAPVFLEIGFGMGDGLVELAARFPHLNFLGIEVYRPGIGHCLDRAAKLELGNLRVIEADAAEVLRCLLPPASLDAVLLYFPDPWPKKRHHKRRIVQPGFVRDVARVLKPGGEFRLATDWRDYAEHMLRVVEPTNEFCNTAGPMRFSEQSSLRPSSKFERRGINLGHGVWDLVYQKPGATDAGHSG